MTTSIIITLAPDELDTRILAMFRLALEPITDAIATRTTNAVQPRKHAYTVAEVAEKINYKYETVLSFIHKGRRDKRGVVRILPKKEITTGDYRVLPADLDKWLSYF